MVYQDGLWKVDGSHLDRYGQDTPRQAVTGFVRAFRNKRYDMLLRYAPRAERNVDASGSWGRAEGEPLGQMSEAVLKKAWEGPQKDEMERLIEAIEAALPNARIEQSGERAVMPYGSEGTVLLVREEGRWKVEDL